MDIHVYMDIWTLGEIYNISTKYTIFLKFNISRVIPEQEVKKLKMKCCGLFEQCKLED